MLPITTCKDCPDRHVGCHGSCQKYLEARAEKEREKEGLYRAINAKKDVEDYKIRKAESAERKHRR